MAARKWTSHELALLGKRPDRELVRKLGRSLHAIVTQRSKLRLARFIADGELRPWTEDEERLLGTDADNVIARRLKRTAVATTKHRQHLQILNFYDRAWTAQEDALLGTTTDKQVAHEIRRATRQAGPPPAGFAWEGGARRVA